MKKERKRFITVSILPASIVFAGITLVPTGILIYMTLTDWSLMTVGKVHFIGLRNYLRLFFDIRLLAAIKSTSIFSVGAVFFELLIGLTLAILLQKSSKIIRTLILLPSMIAPVVVGLLWKIILNYEGPLNSFLHLFGIPKVSWLANPKLTLSTVILVDIWQWSPFMMLIIFSGLQRVESEIIEAAKVDGANNYQIFYYITIPRVLPVILIAVAIRLIDALKTFDTVFIMTRGGPGYVTQLLSIYAYQSGITFGNIAYAASMSFILLIVILYISRFILGKRVL